MNNDPKTIKEEWGVDPLEGVTLNEIQQTIVNESLGLEQSMRTEKPVSMELENKYSGLFSQCDDLIKKNLIKKNLIEGNINQTLNYDSLKKLLRNVYINENPEWHLEKNSLVHIKIVMSRGIETGDDDLIKAALYHDISKFDDVSFNKQGWPTSLEHDKSGAEVAKSDGMNDVVVYVCAKHMVIKSWQGSSKGGEIKSLPLNPSTKYKIFAAAPGNTPDEKAKAFWKLCVFTNMDNMDMGKEFNAGDLKWDNPTYEKWDEECPLKDIYKKSELIEIKVEKPKPPFSAGEILAFGVQQGPEMGKIIGAITGKTREEALEIIKQMTGNSDLQMPVVEKKWIKTYESFRKNK